MLHSISAGSSTIPASGLEHAWLHDLRRVEYVPVSDREALDAFQLLTKLEGIIPALESAHAVAEATKRAPRLPAGHLMVVNLSGRGDKDLETVAKATGAAMSGPDLGALCRVGARGARRAGDVFHLRRSR